MNPRTKNLAMAGGAVIVAGFVAVSTLVAPPAAAPDGAHAAATSASEGSAGTTGATRGPQPTVAPSGTGPAPAGSAGATPGTLVDDGATVPTPDRRSYALGLHDLAGLPPDSPAGTRLELWVTWEPPATRGPRLQKLIGDVVLERTIPGAVPEAPVTVVLSVPAGRVGDLIYADGYGKLSAVLPH